MRDFREVLEERKKSTWKDYAADAVGLLIILTVLFLLFLV